MEIARILVALLAYAKGIRIIPGISEYYYKKGRFQLGRVLSLFCLLLCSQVYAVDRVVYPPPMAKGDARFEVYIDVLQAALDATQKDFGGYELVPASFGMSEARYMKELALKRAELTVAWSGTTYVDMASLRSIRAPIVKGLLSYRLIVAHRDQLGVFSNIQNVEQLKSKTAAHAHGWGDSLVFANAELPYLESGYRGIFDLVQHKRVDYISRGVTEVLDELIAREESHPDLFVAPKLMLFYPWPYYFYVNRENRELEKRLTLGMQRIRESGVHDQILQKHLATELTMLNASGRKVLSLKNPWLDTDWQEACSNCWYVPEGFKLND